MVVDGGAQVVGGEQAGLDTTAQDEQVQVLSGGERARCVRPRPVSEGVGLVVIACAGSVQGAERCAGVWQGLHRVPPSAGRVARLVCQAESPAALGGGTSSPRLIE